MESKAKLYLLDESLHVRVVTKKVKGKQRPRTTKTGHIYTPRETAQEEKLIRNAWINDKAEYTGPVEMVIRTHNKAPKSYSFKQLAKPDLQKPDLDNVAKLVCDALNGVAYKDDAQIVTLKIQSTPRNHDDSYYDVRVRYFTEIELPTTNKEK